MCANLAPIFAQGDITDVVGAVLDGPMPTPELRHLLDAHVLGWQASRLSERQFSLNTVIRSAAFFDDGGVTTPQNET